MVSKTLAVRTYCNSETPGEDPYLSGQYAINFVKGFQEHPEAPGEVMASACCKHYVANSMDGSTVDGHQATRVDFNAVISEQDLVDSYLAPFQACVEQGEVTSLMCRCVQPIRQHSMPCLGSPAALKPGCHLQLQLGERQTQLCKSMAAADCCPRPVGFRWLVSALCLSASNVSNPL